MLRQQLVLFGSLLVIALGSAAWNAYGPTPSSSSVDVKHASTAGTLHAPAVHTTSSSSNPSTATASTKGTTASVPDMAMPLPETESTSAVKEEDTAKAAAVGDSDASLEEVSDDGSAKPDARPQVHALFAMTKMHGPFLLVL